MPKDTTASASATDPSAPLKRGDACLHCRKRRIKCNAEKPVCNNCQRGGKECVYDAGKPVSRVKQLEDKVAELQSMLLASQAARAVDGSPPIPQPPPQPPAPASTAQPPANPFDMMEMGSYTYTTVPPPAGAGPIDATAYHTAFNPAPNPAPPAQSIDPANALPPSFFSPPLQNDIDAQMLHPSRADPTAIDSFDWTTLDPSFMDLVSSFGDTLTRPQDQSQSAMEVDPSLSASSGSYPAFSTPSAPASTAPTSSFGGPGLHNVSIQPTPSPQAHSQSGQSSNSLTSDTQPRTQLPLLFEDPPQNNIPDGKDVKNSRVAVYFLCDQAEGMWMENRRAPQPRARISDFTEEDLVGGWYDPTDLPKVARDHLLDLFFTGMRLFSQVFHVPRFFASLSLPPAKRPHPCMLHSMFLLACRLSSSMAIRSLEKRFLSIALEKLEESISGGDRLFDAVRAATFLSVYKYSLGRYHEGWMMAGRAAQLAISCGLHTIPSSVWKPSGLPNDPRIELMAMMRQRSFVLPPPEDAVELGERIWAFWCIYCVDRCGAISTIWPASITENVVSTPYPRPLHEYELGLVSECDDDSLSTLYKSDPNRKPLPHYAESTHGILRMRAIAILDRASKLMHLDPEPGWDETLDKESESSNKSSPEGHVEYMTDDEFKKIFGISPARPNISPAGSGSSTSSRRDEPTKHRGWTRTPKIRTPKAYNEVIAALRRVEDDMPPERRTNWEVWDGKVQDWHYHDQFRRDFATLHFILGCAWMFAFDVFSFNSPNDRAVAVARRMAFTVRCVMHDGMKSDLDIFIAMTWSFILKILIRESKRLKAKGDLTSLVSLEGDIEIVVQALKIFGTRYDLAKYQANRADYYRASTQEDTQFMEEVDESAFNKVHRGPSTRVEDLPNLAPMPPHMEEQGPALFGAGGDV